MSFPHAFGGNPEDRAVAIDAGLRASKLPPRLGGGADCINRGGLNKGIGIEFLYLLGEYNQQGLITSYRDDYIDREKAYAGDVAVFNQTVSRAAKKLAAKGLWPTAVDIKMEAELGEDDEFKLFQCVTSFDPRRDPYNPPGIHDSTGLLSNRLARPSG